MGKRLDFDKLHATILARRVAACEAASALRLPSPRYCMRAKYQGVCERCKGEVAVGEFVKWSPGEKGVVHRRPCGKAGRRAMIAVLAKARQ